MKTTNSIDTLQKMDEIAGPEPHPLVVGVCSTINKKPPRTSTSSTKSEVGFSIKRRPERVRASRKAVAVRQVDGETPKGVRTSEEQRSPIILKFKFEPTTNNRVDPQLATDLANGRLINNEDIRRELLYGVGALPKLTGPVKKFAAISDTVTIDHARIRAKINLAEKLNRLHFPQKYKPFDMDKEYDRLLALQKERYLPGQSRFTTLERATLQSGRIATSSGTACAEPDVAAKVIVKDKNIVYIQLDKKEYLMERNVVLIPRLTQEEIDSFKSTPKESEEGKNKRKREGTTTTAQSRKRIRQET